MTSHYTYGVRLDDHLAGALLFLKKNQNAPRPSEHPPVMGNGRLFCSILYHVFLEPSEKKAG